VGSRSLTLGSLPSDFFLVFETLILRLFGVSLSMVRIVGGCEGIDAITRIVGFFVSAMGVALIFDSVIEALQTYCANDCASDPSGRSSFDELRTPVR